METLETAAREVAAGDSTAFERIVQATSSLLVRYAARMLGNLADAEDVVQEAYVSAYRALVAGQFDGRSSVTTWLYRIVTHAAIDQRRRRGAKQRAADTLAAGDVASPPRAEAHLALKELSEWLELIPEEQRAALILRAVEGLSNSEIAQILNVSEGAVEQRLVRARAALRARRAS